MARCPDCNKFVGIEMADPELELEVANEGTVTGTVRLVQTCSECGTELAEANLDVEVDVEVAHKEGCKQESGLSIEDESADNDDRYEGKGRGARHFYVANITGKVKCDECAAEVEFETSVEEQASSFESLV